METKGKGDDKKEEGKRANIANKVSYYFSSPGKTLISDMTEKI